MYQLAHFDSRFFLVTHTQAYTQRFFFSKGNLRPSRQEVLDTARQPLPFLWLAAMRNAQLKLGFHPLEHVLVKSWGQRLLQCSPDLPVHLPSPGTRKQFRFCHPSTNQVQLCLASEIRLNWVHPGWDGCSSPLLMASGGGGQGLDFL